MAYVKKAITEEAKADMRVNLLFKRLKLSPDPVCDFCGNDAPITVYAAKKLTTGEKTRCWRWCACKQCTFLIDTGAWDDLAHRIAEMLRELFPVDPGEAVLLNSAKLALYTFKAEALEE